MKPTFKEIVAGAISILCVVALILIYFIPSKSNPQVVGGIVIAFIGAFGEVRHYLFGSTSGSQAKDDAVKETTNNLISQLGQSQPLVPVDPLKKNT